MPKKPENVEVSIEGDTLTIKIDLKHRAGFTAAGKSERVATTSGNIPLPGRPEFIFSVNCFKPLKRSERPPFAK